MVSFKVLICITIALKGANSVQWFNSLITSIFFHNLFSYFCISAYHSFSKFVCILRLVWGIMMKIHSSCVLQSKMITSEEIKRLFKFWLKNHIRKSMVIFTLLKKNYTKFVSIVKNKFFSRRFFFNTNSLANLWFHIVIGFHDDRDTSI